MLNHIKVSGVNPMKSDKKALMVEGLPKLLLLLGLCVFIAACNSSGNTYQMSPVMVQEYSSEPYKIGVGDQIRVDVWGNEKLSLDVPVRPDEYT